MQWPGSISWYDFYQQSWCRMPPEYRAVGDRVGLRDTDLLKLAHGQVLSKIPDDHNKKRAVSEFRE